MTTGKGARLLTTVLGLAGAMLVAEPAMAHHLMGGRMPSSFGEGLLSGLGHPVIGLDHLAAVVAIGCLAAAHRAGAALAIGFVAAMMAGVAVTSAAASCSATGAADTAPDAGVEPDDIRTIRYTSGTTAAPKGCLGTHRQILSSIDNFLKQVPVPQSGPFLQMLPLFSGAGIWMSIAAAYHGVANVLMPVFNPQIALNAIATHGVVHTCGVPTMVSRLTEELEEGRYAIGSLRLFGYTGAKMPPATIRRALQSFDCGFYQGFGGGEMGGLVSYLMPDDHRAALQDGTDRLASVGRPAGYVEIRIRDLKDGTPLPANEPGEIAVRSASNFSGYLNRPEDTARTLRGEWVFTGDVGYIDDDGYLYAVDRAKDMIVTGGMNVSSAEVEAALSEHPAVKSVAVIGLPSEEWGEAVTAVVVLREDGNATPAQLMQFARQRLAGYKSPKAVHFVSEFPLNSVGKVLKRELRDQFAIAAQR